MDTKIHRAIFSAMNLMPNPVRQKYFNLIGLCPKSSTIRKGLYIDFPSKVKINSNSFINHHVQFTIGWTNDADVKIGKNVFVAPNVCFYCVSHNIGTQYQRASENTYSSIVVEDGAWIGANAVILQGVTIGKGSILCAGAVANRNIPQNEMWGGTSSLY